MRWAILAYGDRLFFARNETITVDPATGIVYETEDRGTAGFYRFIPNQTGTVAAGSRLQMLAIKDPPTGESSTLPRIP